MSVLTRRALLGAAAGLGLSIAGLGGLLALRRTGDTPQPATAVLAEQPATSAPPSQGALATTAPTPGIPSPVAGAPPSIQPTSAVVPTGTTTPAVTKGGSIVEITVADATTNNPLLASDTASLQRIAMQYEGLLDLNPADALPVPRLATAVPSRENGGISADGLTYTFTLRPNVKWSDGPPLTAKDVAYSYTTMQNPASGSPRAATLADRLASVAATDDLTVVFTLKRPLASFLADHATYPLAPQHILKDVPPANLKAHPFSTGDPDASVSLGPFTLSAWQGDRAVLVKNPTYHGGEPHLDRYTFRVARDAGAVFAALKAGDADVGTIALPDWPEARQLPNVTPHAYPGFGFTYYCYQLDPARTTLFADKRVRQALAYALDRDALAGDILGGLATVAQGTLPPFSWAHQPEQLAITYTHDPQRAEALLDAAGWLRGPDGIRARNGQKLQFTLWTNAGGTTREQYAAAIQQQWRPLGIDATPRAEEWSAFLRRITQTRDFEMFLTGFSWGADPDQSPMWSTDAYANGFNLGRYSNPRVDTLLQQGQREPDPEQRKVIYLELQNILLDDLPSFLLDFPHTTALVNKRIHNFTPNPPNTRGNAHLWWTTDGQ